jgi:hypothetical protein
MTDQISEMVDNYFELEDRIERVVQNPDCTPLTLAINFYAIEKQVLAICKKYYGKKFDEQQERHKINESLDGFYREVEKILIEFEWSEEKREEFQRIFNELNTKVKNE